MVNLVGPCCAVIVCVKNSLIMIGEAKLKGSTTGLIVTPRLIGPVSRLPPALVIMQV